MCRVTRGRIWTLKRVILAACGQYPCKLHLCTHVNQFLFNKQSTKTRNYPKKKKGWANRWGGGHLRRRGEREGQARTAAPSTVPPKVAGALDTGRCRYHHAGKRIMRARLVVEIDSCENSGGWAALGLMSCWLAMSSTPAQRVWKGGHACVWGGESPVLTTAGLSTPMEPNPEITSLRKSASTPMEPNPEMTSLCKSASTCSPAAQTDSWTRTSLTHRAGASGATKEEVAPKDVPFLIKNQLK